LDEVPIKDDVAFHSVMRAIAGCVRLESLSVGFFLQHSLVEGAITTIAFNCPPSIKKLALFLNVLNERHVLVDPSQSASTAGLQDTPTTAFGDVTQELPEHQRSLPNLIELVVGGEYFHRQEGILAVLKMCPELVTLGMPVFWRAIIADDIARFVVKNCPKIQNLTQHQPSLHSNHSVMLPIVRMMPEGALTSIDLGLHPVQEIEVFPILRRHFSTLGCIHFDETSILSSGMIQTILFNCPILDDLEATSRRSPQNYAITLQDATAQPWASTRFYSLSLVIDMSDTVIPRMDWTDLTSIQQAKSQQMDTLYRQIGRLTDLRYLDLKMHTDSDPDVLSGSAPTYRDRCFPGLLTLGDGLFSRRRGWLGCLAGLKKLEVLSGSFKVTTRVGDCVMTQPDVEWIVQHWPKLESADFYFMRREVDVVHWSDCLHDNNTEAGADFHPCMLWLIEQLPNLLILQPM